jgi:signal transduction histidine kinase
VFERFHKADKSRGVDRASLGLGLYIVRTILSNMGEKISVTSEGGLTSFVFTLSEAKR